ncbi:hypothetical protein Glove_428g42 [Diversispora epigaea]|uniref:BACK domain-containing protein n=1 Tax=Diversispora epigaea TaxID=1348612 RepID=A0A397GY61_9GLOM|nr:hypothetical protein Glove_428g42 [Diversispora epigaea]
MQIKRHNHNVIIEAKNKKIYTAPNVLKYRSPHFRKELDKKLETVLIETKVSRLKKYFSLVYQNILYKKNFKDLEFCNDIVAKYPNLIFDNSDFTSLPEFVLVSFLKRDDFQMKEVEIWDNVVKWGIAQNPTLPINPVKWSKENLLMLKTTLQQCLPLIRYFHISKTEIHDKIRPYKKILDKQLWRDINQHLQDHAAEISSWIDRKTTIYSTTDIPYKFELIFRGTRVRSTNILDIANIIEFEVFSLTC